MRIESIYTHRDSIRLASGQIFARLVSVDGSRKPAKTLLLIVDTGAFITVINKEKAEESGYKIIEERGLNIRGFSEKGLVCDLRVIPEAVFCGFRIKDVLVATPHDDGVKVSEVLGMNILENFSFGFDLNESEIYLSARGDFISQKPHYSCGDISIFEEEE
ncbi:MAG: hypothetical protein LBE35_10620 [Clostridiales bacterium]|jgi:predicted aspartyl protease|nr:hypothetical protein [Clostridiales bacterium]